MNKYHIRKALQVDAPAISAVIIPVVKEFVSFEYTPLGAKVMLDSMSEKEILANTNQSIEYFIAQENSKVIGILGIKQENHLYHFLWIKITTDKSWRKFMALLAI